MIKDATWRGISVRRAMSFIDLKKKKIALNWNLRLNRTISELNVEEIIQLPDFRYDNWNKEDNTNTMVSLPNTSGRGKTW